jgi:hypothetical protein
MEKAQGCGMKFLRQELAGRSFESQSPCGEK